MVFRAQIAYIVIWKYMEIHRMQRLNSQRAIPSTAVLFEALALQMLHQIFQVESTSKTTQWPPIMSQTPTTNHKLSTSTPLVFKAA